MAIAKCGDQLVYYCKTVKNEIDTQCRLRCICVSANCKNPVTYNGNGMCPTSQIISYQLLRVSDDLCVCLFYCSTVLASWS